MSTKSFAALLAVSVLHPGQPLSAAIIEGERSVELNYTYTVRAGDYTETVSDDAMGSDDTELSVNTELSGETDRSTFDGSLRVLLAAGGSFVQMIDPDDGTVAYTLMTGKQSSLVQLSGSGVFLMEAERGTGAFTSAGPGNEFLVPFDITENTEEGRFRLSMQRKLETDNPIQCFIQRREGEVWVTQKSYAISGRTSFYTDTISFEPGEWRVLCKMPAVGSFAEGEGTPDELDLEQELEFTLEFGTPLGSHPLPPEGDFTRPEIFTEVVNSSKLAVVSPQILGEASQGDGTTEIEYTTNLVNSSLCPWREILVTVRNDRPERISVENLLHLAFLNVPATSTVPGEHSGRILVADAQLPAVRAGILDGSLLTTEGKELIVFRYPVDFVVNQGVVEDTTPKPYQIEDTISPTFVVFSGAEEPLFPAGSLILEWEPFYAVPPRRIQSVGFSKVRWEQNFDDKLPMWITSASVNSGTIQDPRYTSTFSGASLTFFDIVKHGRFQHVVSNPLAGYTRNATEGNEIDTQLLFGTTLPIHFDRIKLDDIVTLSGNFNFVPGPFVIDYEIANGSPEEFLVTMEYTAEANLLLETANHEEVGGSPVVDAEKTLFEAPLFSVQLPGGITFTPRFKLEAGAVVDATRSLSIPFTSRYTVKVTAGVKDGLPFYDDQSTFEPLKVSDPSIYEAIGASASAFLNAELAALFTYPNSLSAGPTVGARLEGDFEVTPLVDPFDPWWSISSDLHLTAGVELDFAEVINIIDAEKPLQTFPLYSADAGGPLLAKARRNEKGIDPKAGALNPGIRPLTKPTERWARSIESTDDTAPGSLFLIPLTGSPDVLTGQSSTLSNRIHRIAADGAILKTISAVFPFTFADASPADDGGAFILGKRTGLIEIARLDPDLNLTGGLEFSMPLTYVPLRLQSTSTQHYVLGRGTGGSPGRQKPILTCLDHDGAVVWSKTYDLPDNPAVNAGDFLICSDGNLVLCGTTSARFEENDGLDPGYLLVNLTNNGYASKIDAETGTPLWTTLIAHRNVPTYNAIAESPTGEFTIGGRNAVGILEEEPTMMVVQLGPEGEFLESLLIGHSGSSKSQPNSDAEDLFVVLPQDGETLFDEIRDLVWTEEGLWVCGEMGIYNGGQPTRFNGSIGFSLFLDPKLNPGRFAIHGGKARDTFDRLLVTEEGPLCAGISYSFHPWPSGSAGESDHTPLTQWLVKLPWEGRLDFHELSNAVPSGEEPLGGSFYVYPRVMSGLLTGNFDINQPEYDSYGRGDDRISDAARDLLAEDNSPEASAFSMSFSSAEVAEVKALEYLPRSLIIDEETYFDWYQLDPEDDRDRDGLCAVDEFFLGSDPTLADLAPIEFELLDGDPRLFEITLSRSKLATGLLPTVLSSSELLDLLPRNDVTVDVDPLDSERDLLRLTLPAPQDRQFYQVALPRRVPKAVQP